MRGTRYYVLAQCGEPRPAVITNAGIHGCRDHYRGSPQCSRNAPAPLPHPCRAEPSWCWGVYCGPAAIGILLNDLSCIVITASRTYNHDFGRATNTKIRLLIDHTKMFSLLLTKIKKNIKNAQCSFKVAIIYQSSFNLSEFQSRLYLS